MGRTNSMDFESQNREELLDWRLWHGQIEHSQLRYGQTPVLLGQSNPSSAEGRPASYPA